MTLSLYDRIRHFYDQSSGLWEQTWGEHMHHGYYGVDGRQSKDRRQAQIDLIDELLRWANIQQPRQILDVGCGIGGSSLYLADRFNATVTGITLSPVQAERARQRARESGHVPTPGRADDEACPPKTGTQFLVANALEMPFPDQSFDLVWSLESGEHIPNKIQLFQECFRVLQPGGTLLFVTWCHRPTLHSPLTPGERHHLEQIYQVYCLPYVLSLPEYETIARRQGFQSISTADWSAAVAPFWNSVIESALSPESIFGLLSSGWSTIQAALALGLMQQGYASGLIRFGLLHATRP